MSIKSQMKKSKTIVGLKSDLKVVKRLLLLIKRRRIVHSYFSENTIYKLQLGSNITKVQGWLCSDLVPASKNCIYLDVTKKFPFKNGLFDYVHSEHMIEHISWIDGLNMLKEAFRILKKGGKIRIATPDLGFFIFLYTNQNSEKALEYIKWSSENFIREVDCNKASFVINSIFRNWDHQFIYDKELLTNAFQKAGFVNIKCYNNSQSDDFHLKNIENHGLNVGNEKMINYETLVLEGTKP